MQENKMPEEESVDIPIEETETGGPEAEQEQDPEIQDSEMQDPDPLTILEEALAQEKDRALRLAAEYENYRKRSQKEREALYVDVKSNVVAALLPVYDNLERALKQETTDEAFFKGVEMTMTQLREILQGFGVEEIPAVGERFDPLYHNAVFHIEDEGFGENEIVEQFLTGFRLGDKIIRHSVVKVAN